ncbi:IclR family transcriptional regulator [Rathayibacter soli]|uniref:IclR family transcriptional regulator n=1 Tax=Rathayibacter soli TaxID=3144168 RepID=UPI0027E3B9CD|nr:IclR family transcriptional regulator [Glaciibacter superstes]
MRFADKKAGRPTTLSELARKVRLSKPATYVLLKTLEGAGLVARDATARYGLSWGLYELGSAVIRPLDLARAARMRLDHLAERTGEILLLGILHHGTVLYLDRGQRDDAFAMVANVGRRSPLHTTASGKVLLAHQDSAYIDAYVGGPLVQATSVTITDAAVLASELELVRKRGYATCSQEQEIGLSSLAVPVGSACGAVQASLAIAAPTSRFTGQVLPGLLAELTNTAAAITRSLTAEAQVEPSRAELSR